MYGPAWQLRVKNLEFVVRMIMTYKIISYYFPEQALSTRRFDDF